MGQPVMWRPMSEAPKDKTVILKYRWGGEEWISEGSWDDQWEVCSPGGLIAVREPLGWMEVPI